MNQNVISYSVSQIMAKAVATGLFVSLCTIQQPSGTLTANGAPDGNFTSVTGLVSIACMDAPEVVENVRADQNRETAKISDETVRHVLLDDYYANLIAGWRDGWRAIVDGGTYNLRGVEADSQRTQTRLRLALVTV